MQRWPSLVKLVLVWLVFACSAALAAEKPMTVTVYGIEGDVDVRLPGAKEWQPARKGMKLLQGSEIQTALFSSAELLFEDTSAVIIEGVTQIKIDKFLKDNVAVRTKLNLRCGSVQATVNKGPLETDFKVSTPNSTASVRGTQIRQIRTTPRGDRFRMGGEGGLFAKGHAGGTAFIQAHQGTRTSTDNPRAIIAALRAARDSQTVETLGIGATVAERQAFAARKRYGDTNPGDLTGSGAPSVQFTKVKPAPAAPPSPGPSPGPSSNCRRCGRWYEF